MAYMNAQLNNAFPMMREGYLSDGPTRRQRHALYRFGVSKRRVHMLTRDQASALLDILISSIPVATYERKAAPTGRPLPGNH